MDCLNPTLAVRDQGNLVPLRLLRECCVPLDTIRGNLQHTFSAPYRPMPVGRTISIVGSGPSIHRTLGAIERTDTVLSCNAAHEFLLQRGIVPHYAMLWDGAEVVSTMFSPDHRVTYLVASRCHPSVFEKLEGYNVLVWHAASDDEGVMDHLEDKQFMEPVIQGGSAAVVRAMFLALMMRFSKHKLFGCDGSFEGEFTHFKKSAVPETEIEVHCAGRKFRTTAWLAAQAEEVPILFPILKGLGVEIEVYGDGLIPHMAKTLGYTVKES